MFTKFTKCPAHTGWLLVELSGLSAQRGELKPAMDGCPRASPEAKGAEAGALGDGDTGGAEDAEERQQEGRTEDV